MRMGVLEFEPGTKTNRVPNFGTWFQKVPKGSKLVQPPREGGENVAELSKGYEGVYRANEWVLRCGGTLMCKLVCVKCIPYG